jgi:hypothetical protein
MLALTSPTSGGRSVGIFRSQTQASEFPFHCLAEYSFIQENLEGLEFL